MTDDKIRLDKFTQAAREPETGDDPARLKEKPGRLAKVPLTAADNTAKGRKGG